MSYGPDKLKFGVNSDFEVKFDLEGQGHLPPKTIGTLTKVFASLVQIWQSKLEQVPSYRADKQVIDTQTDTHTRTHTQTQAMTITEGQNWPWVKKCEMWKKKVA